MNERKYYVYKHIRLDTNTTFYIGKGTGKRAIAKEYRNQYWHNIVNKYNYRVEYIRENLTENEANILEHKMILLYKRYNRAETNINLDSGIGGRLGRTDEDYRLNGLKVSLKVKGTRIGINNSNFGNKLSEESKKKISEAKKGKRIGVKQSLEHVRKRVASRLKKSIDL